MLRERGILLGRATLEALRDLFYPSHCAHCGVSVRAGWICSTCRADIRPVTDPKCETCSHSYPGMDEHRSCANCGDRQFYFDTAVGVMQGRGVLRDLIHHFKYGHAAWLAEPLAELLAEGLDDQRLVDRTFDGIVPVPLHPKRQREREYNQAELLAREMGRKTGLSVRNVLQRTRYTVTQTHFDRQQRMQNLREAFSLRQNASVLGLNLLLVDDVFTTGSTLDECARVLISAGAETVCALTLARG